MTNNPVHVRRILPGVLTDAVYDKEREMGKLAVQKMYPGSDFDYRGCVDPECCGHGPSQEIITTIDTESDGTLVLKFFICE